MPRVLRFHADFNKTVSPQGGHPVLGIPNGDHPSDLSNGMRVLLIEPGDFSVKATVMCEARRRWWVGVADWGTRIDCVDEVD